MLLALLVSVMSSILEQRYYHIIDHITDVEAHLSLSMYVPEWFGYVPADDQIDNPDHEALAGAFNSLLETMSQGQVLEHGLRSFTEVLSSQIDLAKLARVSLDKLFALTGTEAGVIFLDNDGRLEPLIAAGLRDPATLLNLRGVKSALHSGRTARLDLANESVRVEIIEDFGQSAQPARELLVGPLMLKDQNLGLVVLASAKSSNQQTAGLFDLLRVSLGFALTHAQARAKMQQLATFDSLTNAYNRRFGLERLHQEYTRALRSQQPISVLMLDLDYFKRINDTYGHLAGDETLRRIAGVCREAIREADILLRYGGEEFLVILPDADLTKAVLVRERLRLAVQAAHIVHDGHDITLTVSLGATTYLAGQTNSEEQMLAEADAALYMAKGAGRGQLYAYRPDVRGHLPAADLLSLAGVSNG
jgi:diguanylate cyclase (GGDEF)-like protein